MHALNITVLFHITDFYFGDRARYERCVSGLAQSHERAWVDIVEACVNSTEAYLMKPMASVSCKERLMALRRASDKPIKIHGLPGESQFWEQYGILAGLRKAADCPVLTAWQV
jgi:hypothetical protein